jgi:hypothetical protein
VVGFLPSVGSLRSAPDPILPHHGIVAKISPDGRKFEVLATGLRAPGGVGVGPNGEITTGENEGTWQPCCKINFVAAKDTPAFFLRGRRQGHADSRRRGGSDRRRKARQRKVEAAAAQSQRTDTLEGDARKQYEAIWHWLHAEKP